MGSVDQVMFAAVTVCFITLCYQTKILSGGRPLDTLNIHLEFSDDIYDAENRTEETTTAASLDRMYIESEQMPPSSKEEVNENEGPSDYSGNKGLLGNVLGESIQSYVNNQLRAAGINMNINMGPRRSHRRNGFLSNQWLPKVPSYYSEPSWPRDRRRRRNRQRNRFRARKRNGMLPAIPTALNQRQNPGLDSIGAMKKDHYARPHGFRGMRPHPGENGYDGSGPHGMDPHSGGNGPDGMDPHSGGKGPDGMGPHSGGNGPDGMGPHSGGKGPEDFDLSSCKCGIENVMGNRIIGGGETEPHRFPWMVRLKKRGVGICTASLISDRHILTAFHCVRDSITKRPYDHSDGVTKAYIGGHVVGALSMKHDAEIVRTLSTPTVHDYPPFPNIDETNPESHDIVVYTLDEPVQFSPNVRPLCLPQRFQESYEGMQALAAGWGDYLPGENPNSDVLRSVELTIATSLPLLPKMFTTFTEKNIYGDYMDPCAGDSGGPLMWQNKDGKFVALGVVNGGGYQCDKDLVSSFHGTRDQVWNNVTSHLDFLETKLREDPNTRRCA